jgi:tRNA threonylcarbamoyl adenosine modification protein YeaZ/ribosomal-protein-alanine acetyltransferase
MHVLALDTTTRDGSVALVDEHRTIAVRSGDGAHSHAERLPGDLSAIAAGHGLSLPEIDLFAVASGPGSFTGLRVGIATVQGLALATGRSVVAVSALEALAHTVQDAPPGALVAAWIDARRGDVFASLYRIAGEPVFAPERLVVVDEPTVDTPAATLARWRRAIDGRGATFIGDGAVHYREAIAAESADSIVVEPTPLIAGTIGRIAAIRAARGEAVHPAAIRPLYIRRPDAEIDRDKRAAAWIIEPLSSPSEIEAVVAIENESFTNPWTREMYLAELEKPGMSYCYLARNRAGEMVGFCSFWRVVDELHINNLAVRPPHRRAGVATALLTRVLRDGAKLGASRATLEVRESNGPARVLYERLGFVVAGTRRGYYTKPDEDAIILSRGDLGELSAGRP